jgi:hypothetical protein
MNPKTYQPPPPLVSTENIRFTLTQLDRICHGRRTYEANTLSRCTSLLVRLQWRSDRFTPENLTRQNPSIALPAPSYGLLDGRSCPGLFSADREPGQLSRYSDRAKGWTTEKSESLSRGEHDPSPQRQDRLWAHPASHRSYFSGDKTTGA